ncbi:MAG: DUF2798 domain-containing protein [Candidatus Absconditabacteria bacterium]
MNKINKKYQKLITGIVKIFLMTLVMSFITSVRNNGLNIGIFYIWMKNWFLIMLFVYPIVFLIIDPIINYLSKKVFTN